MRVFKHGNDKEYFIKDTEDIFSPLHPRKLCFSGLDNFPVELSQTPPSRIVLRRSCENEEKVLYCLFASQLRSNTIASQVYDMTTKLFSRKEKIKVVVAA